jgi:hypothetical protein
MKTLKTETQRQLDLFEAQSAPTGIPGVSASPCKCSHRLLTIAQAAGELNLPAWKLWRAARAGLIPTYTFFNTRKLVRVSDVLESLQSGGAS